jgi:3-hydroxybutyryl-CoA dehydrogenase
VKSELFPGGQLVVIIGGGRMGAGIAQVCAAAGSQTLIVESDDDAALAAVAKVERGLQLAAGKNMVEDSKRVLARVRATAHFDDIPSEAGLLVEAVPENFSTKLEVLARGERSIGQSCLIASNTSSLSITELSGALKHPERLVGMHFFNPVPVSALLEIVVGKQTSDEAAERAMAWAKALDKQAVVVRDSPGFATSRLGVLLGLEAIRMLEEGVADATSIDRAMELGYGHLMGPLRSTDLVGLDVRLAIAEHLRRSLGVRFEPPALLRAKVQNGELGRKTGRGFYEWT